MDFVEIVIDGAIDIDRDDVEEALTDALEGAGEVTGAGTSSIGSNLDLEIAPGADRIGTLNRIFNTLRDLGVGDAARVRPGDSTEWIRLSGWQA